jgi:hypothetical protein
MMPCAAHNEHANCFTSLSRVEMAFQNYVHTQTSIEKPQVMMNAEYKVNH